MSKTVINPEEIKEEKLECKIEYHYFWECNCGDGHAFVPNKVTKGDTIMCECCLTEHVIT